MLRILLSILLFSSYIFAQDEISIDELEKLKPQSEQSIKKNNQATKKKDIITLDQLKKIAPSDEESLNIDDSTIYQEVKKTDLLLSISDLPKNVYVNQVFSLNLSADIQQDINVDLNLTLNNNENLLWLNKEHIKWSKIKGGVFQTQIWLEANSTKANMSNIKVVLKRNGEFFQEASIKFKPPTFKDVGESENFSHIVTERLQVLTHKAASFDDKSNILTIELVTDNGNLNSLYIDNDNIIKQGVDSIRGVANKQSGYYFVVLDKDEKDFSFSYFNLMTNKFEEITLPIIVEDGTISTQSELNPKENPFTLYKTIAIYTVIAIFLVMFIVSKNTTPLIFAVLLGLFQIYSETSYETGIVNKESKVRILPISNSTIFYIPSKDEKVEIFMENDEYCKVLFKNGKIGWVNKKDIK